MVATTAPMPPARHDPTSREALARAGRSEESRPLMVSIEEWCGEQLLTAFLRCANAVFTGRDAETQRHPLG